MTDQDKNGDEPVAAGSWAAQGPHADGVASSSEAGVQPTVGDSAEAWPSGGYGPVASFPEAAPVIGGSKGSRVGLSVVVGVGVVALVLGGAAGGVVGFLASEHAPGAAGTSLVGPVPARRSAPAPVGSVEAVAAKLLPSVVQLQVTGGPSAGEGSGIILSPDGDILTNNHVVEGAARGGQLRVVFANGQQGSASIVGRDPTTDIAVVRAEGVHGVQPATWGRSEGLQVGQEVVAFGAPFALSGTVTSGIVSALHRPVRAGGGAGGQATVLDAVQTDAAINPGNSGGPLANMAGEVIGMNSAIYSPGGGPPGRQQQPGQDQGGNVGIGFAIPGDQAHRVADELLRTGTATQTLIGAMVSDNPDGGGALIRQVTPGSPAERAGLKQGDVVTGIDERRIASSDALVAAVRSRNPGEHARFVLSDGRNVDVVLGGQPVQAN